MLIYKRELSDDEVEILQHDLLDIEQWINDAINGKINSCLKRGANQHRMALKISGAKTMPADDLVAFKEMINASGYKDRKNRERGLLRK